MFGICSKLVRLFKLVQVTDCWKDTSLLQNLSIFQKLQMCNVWYYEPNAGMAYRGQTLYFNPWGILRPDKS